ncbi:MAG: amine oxidase, partial [Myxococcota bacterium]
FAGAAYLSSYEDTSVSKRLAESIDDQVYFAGDAYTTFDDWGSVHAAVRSAIEASEEVMRQ